MLHLPLNLSIIAKNCQVEAIGLRLIRLKREFIIFLICLIVDLVAKKLALIYS